jgi:hypothetical protein
MGQRLVDALNDQAAVRQPSQRVMCCLLPEGRLGVLQVCHPLTLIPEEIGDLALLSLLRAEVGEGEAKELVPIHIDGRGSNHDWHHHTVAADEIELDRGAPPSRASGPR